MSVIRPIARSLLALALLLGCEGASVVGGAALDAPTDAPTAPADASSADAVFVDRSAPDVGADAADAVGDDRAAVRDGDPTDADVGAWDAEVDVSDVGPPPRDAPAGLDGAVPSSVETVAVARVVAGQPIAASCLVRDQWGALTVAPGAAPVVRFSPTSAVRVSGGSVIAVRPGTVEARCELPSLGLTDPSPARVEIGVGVGVRTRASVDRTSVVAGESVEVRCSIFDVEGNELPSDAVPTRVAVTPSRSSRVDGRRVTLEAAGAIALSCAAPEVVDEPATVNVRPGGAVRLVIGGTLCDMCQRVDVGRLVIFDGIALDRFGNHVPGVAVTWSYTPMPRVEPEGPNFVRFVVEGDYTVRARATGEGGAPLTAERRVLANSRGPVVECTSPAHASMLATQPGSPIVVSGTAVDANGVRQVRVRPQGATEFVEVPVDTAGRWTATIPSARFGVNYIDIVSEDADFVPSLTSCAFLVADRWAPEGALASDSLGFYLAQSGIDDGAPTTPITSVNDFLQRILAGPTLATEVATALRQANPVYNNPCAYSPFPGFCVAARIDVNGVEMRGPNTSSMRLVDNGLALEVVAQNVILAIRATTGAGTFDGTMAFSRITVGATYDVGLVSGRIRARLRAGTASAQVADPTVTINGLPSQLNGLLNNALSSQIPPLLSGSLRDLVVAQMGAALDGVFGGFDVRSLGGVLTMRALDGRSTAELRYRLPVQSFSATRERVRIMMSSSIVGPTVRGTSSRGIAIPGAPPADPAVQAPAMETLHVLFFNQVLHAMWRAGLFDSDIQGLTILGGSGPLRMRFALPPVAHLGPGRALIIDLGALDCEFAQVAPPLQVRLGVRLSSSPVVERGNIRFGTFEMTELHFAPLNVPLAGEVAQSAELYLRPFIQSLTGEALGRAMPTLPLPSFEVPPELSALGLPVGSQLGLTSAALALEGQQFVIRGGFGVTTP